MIIFNGITMGTTYSVKLNNRQATADKNKIQAEVEQILFDINQSMSTYIDDSELSLLNQSADITPQVLSKDLYTVIEHADYVSRLSHGAFDITVGPLVNLWGFGPDPAIREVPSEKEIELIKQHTGHNKLILDPDSNSITKINQNVYVDLSGIAKGFAVDKIARYLDSLDINDYLIEIGGELIGKGVNTDNMPWQIGIEQATPLEQNIQRVISLDNMAMATSGDYRNYFEQDGIRYSHTIDPVTGKPVTHTLASVTVLDKSAMHADAMATAFMVLGPEQSLTLANKLTTPIYMIVKTEKGFDERYNDLFKIHLSD